MPRGRAILRVQTSNDDFLANAPGAPLTEAQKRDYLTAITYKDYLVNHVGINDEAFFGEYWRGSGGLLGAGGQAVSAADCWILGRPGFPDGVGLGDTEDIQLNGIGRTPFQDSRSNGEPGRAWPDGNTSLVRLALSKLIPNAFPNVDVGDGPRAGSAQHPQGSGRIRPAGQARRTTSASGSTARSSRSSPASDRHGYSPVEYVYNSAPGFDGKVKGKKGRRVWGKHVIMACWNRVTAHVVHGLPKQQVEGLCYARKVPLIYGRAGLNNWQAFADSKVSSVSPRGTSLFWDNLSVSAGAGFGPTATPGKYYGPTPEPAADRSSAAVVHRGPEPPRRCPAAVRLLHRPADAARDELG